MNLIHLEQVDPAKIVYTCIKTEQKVIRLVQEGLPFKEIATSLGVNAVRASKIFYYADKKIEALVTKKSLIPMGKIP